jgi:hypothetical protein
MKVDLRISRIQKLINRLEGGEDVSTSSLSRVLTTEQLENYQENWKDELSLRKIKKPKEIKEYERKIKIASLHYQKMDRFSLTQGKARLAREFANRADDAFEKAYEYLIEQLHANSELYLWIDRKPDPSQRCPIGIPRIIGSSSNECLVKGKTPYPIRTKKELKLQILELALLELTDNDLELKCEPTKIVHFSKTRNFDFSSFRF